MILFTAYLAYRVYHMNEKRFLDPPKAGAPGSQFIVEEQRVQERGNNQQPPSRGSSNSEIANKNAGSVPNSKRAQEEVADHGEIELEMEDGNAKPEARQK